MAEWAEEPIRNSDDLTVRVRAFRLQQLASHGSFRQRYRDDGLPVRRKIIVEREQGSSLVITLVTTHPRNANM